MILSHTYTLMHNSEARPYSLDATTRRPNYNLKFNLYFKKRPLRSVNDFTRLAETYTLMHNIEAQRLDLQDRRTQPNYNLKFNLYYKNRPLRSVNDFARRPSTARPARSAVQLLKLTKISQI